jgi:hypothetical protein
LVIKCTVKNVYEASSSPTGNHGMLLIKLFLARKTSALGLFFPHYERKIPGNPEIQEVFPARKSLISDFQGFPAGDDDPSSTFLTVYMWRKLFLVLDCTVPNVLSVIKQCMQD